MGSVKVSQLTKEFSGVLALKNVSLDIKEGEFFALLGPSGCGKTTTMRCIAGFEQPTSGIIQLGETEVNHIPPNRRNCGMVFQSYALFPHMNVFDNVAYSLNIKQLNASNLVAKLPVYLRLLNRKLGNYPKYIEQKVMEILEYVELDQYAMRLTSELSGGQQQRVALARSLLMEPAVLLMDEPLSNLDQKLRHSMRNTIRRIQQDLGITTIFVTHDQEEAMSMADRVAVMDSGEVKQIGTPIELYSRPSTPFIANFVGTSNVLKGSVIGQENGFSIIKGKGFILKSTNHADQTEVNLIVRPENIKAFKPGTINEDKLTNIIDGTVLVSTYLGSIVRYDIKVDEYQLVVDTTFVPGEAILTEGEKVQLSIDPERVLII
ncbi:ABC transporter ATP-binding protein [Cytobacillus purgationiresistens]|uniref:Iron(III) transport system ATP-binding protein/putative spermidine/putrescine transport system ATP-binding protein n=1 Tax=Cytobacillus purgationiresistens TaxID=863449 RepID=A0ABU0AK50_9BACI|nr:ABC transporter ATP-binding protein [Cytobacillus purgationiresistens]MDQ0271634.1 iron(III) transport system ATP-binding protein/putative spermidine/putrescine transport system ATP-binding protein [Cytobacillus purgationiresistens]